MISPSDIRKKAQTRSLNVFKSQIRGEQWQPWVVGFRSPKESCTTFSEVNEWALSLFRNSKDKKGYGYRVETKTRRFHGINEIPERIVFDTPEDVFAYCDSATVYRNAYRNFLRLKDEFPELEPWLVSNATKIRDYEDEWDDVLSILREHRQNPKPSCYLREFPAAPHSKYLETRKALLLELLNLTAADFLDAKQESFEERFGFLAPPRTSYIRFLDPSFVPAGLPCDWAALPNECIRTLRLPSKLIVSENKVPILSLPRYEDTIAIWGKGKAAALLAREPWIERFEIYYWGDLDCHGLQILSNFRSRYPQTKAIAMDMETLVKFRKLSSSKGAVLEKCPSGLSVKEQELFWEIAKNRTLLEHERIPHSYVLSQFEKAGFVAQTANSEDL